MNEEVKGFIEWCRTRKADSVEFSQGGESYKIKFREPSEREVFAQIEAEMSAMERAAYANSSDEERDKLMQEKREQLLYGSS